ncbi:MAG: hypothetical protein LBU22_02390 [Dysgonamonadaceae bacterium]|jgi:hypothetical protein|nr:hypothetical protein [Dysgonamonadaceae bacterium]
MKEDDLFDKIVVPADLESKLVALIDRLAVEDIRSKRKAARLRLWTSGIAAGIALLITAGLYFQSGRKPDAPLAAQSGNRIEERDIAITETQKALVLVSQNFNKGLDHLALANSKIEKANEKFNHTFNNTFKK